jgi:hypothetical protein
MPPKLEPEIEAARVNRALDCARRDLTLAQAAAELRIPVRTLGGTLERAGIHYGQERLRARAGLDVAGANPALSPPSLSSQEVQDAAFWRRKASEAARRAEEAELLARQLAGVHGIRPDPVPWAMPQATRGTRSTLIVHTSDLHMGEVIRPGEIDGLNEYNPDVARKRMRRLFEAACLIGPRWMEADECDGVLLTLNGDLISGDIHEELVRTNALTSHEQVQAAVEVYDPGIRMLVDKYGRVHVVVTPGNHGRTTHKPTAKLSAKLSYDTLIGVMLRERFKDDPRVTWQIAEGSDVRVLLYGKTILVTHGDKIGTKGGMGFAGPVLPIVRGGHKVRSQAHSAGRDCDLILMGHYHTSAAPPGILANGSVPGYSEYGNDLRATVDGPRQWLARLSQRWGLCERLDVQLDAPPGGKPRVRVTA